MNELKMNLVDDIDLVINPGDTIVVKTKLEGETEYHLDIIHCCPQCGERTTTAQGKKHVFDPKTNSLTPSIVHSKELGGCGWHGWLKNGIFTKC